MVTKSISPIELLFKNNKSIREVEHNGVKYYPIMDIIKNVVSTNNYNTYWSKIKDRKKKLDEIQWFPKKQQLKVKASDGKGYNTECYTREGIFQILQSLPSKKAERFRIMFARIIEERFQEEESPELAYERGYDRAIKQLNKFNSNKLWVSERMGSIEDRKRMSTALFSCSVDGKGIARITDDFYKIAFDMSTNRYYLFKGLIKGKKGHNLKDHATVDELGFIRLFDNSLCQAIQKNKPNGYEEVEPLATKRAIAVRNARLAFEKALGEEVCSPSNNLKLLRSNG